MSEEGKDAISFVAEVEVARALKLIDEIEAVHVMCVLIRLDESTIKKADV